MLRDVCLPRVVTVTVPVRTTNPLNGSHGRWQGKAAKARAVRDAVAWALRPHPAMSLPVRVTMRRCSSSEMDFDGLCAALKPVRDEVAAWLPLARAKRRGRVVADDRDPRVTWRYEQGKARRARKLVAGKVKNVVVHEVVLTVEPWGVAHQAAADVGLGDA